MKQKTKIMFILFLLIFLLILLAYVTNITAMPDSIILFQNEKFSLRTVPGINFKARDAIITEGQQIQNEKTVEASTRYRRK